MADMPDRWLTTAEAATYCGYESKGGIQKAIARGELRPDGVTPGGAP